MHNLAMFDWNDLRHFLAVARHGSTLAAAKALGVNQSTVHRRMCELERRLGRRLVERHPTGYRLTEVGEDLRPLAERMETAAQDFERRAASSDADLIGTVRVTCPETVGYRMMKTSLLDAFQESLSWPTDRASDGGSSARSRQGRGRHRLPHRSTSGRRARQPQAGRCAMGDVREPLLHRSARSAEATGGHCQAQRHRFWGRHRWASCRPLAQFDGTGRSRRSSVHNHTRPRTGRKIWRRIGSTPSRRRVARV